MGRHKEPLKVMRTLTNEEKEKLDKEREEQMSSNTGQTQCKSNEVECCRMQAAQHKEEYHKAREHINKDDTPVLSN